MHHGEVEAVLSTDPAVNESIDKMFAVLNDAAGINDDHDLLDEIEVGIEDMQYYEFKDLLSSSKWDCILAALSIRHWIS